MAQLTAAAARKPGRPPDDGVDHRARLLDAALGSFAERGIEATSLRSLARQTGLSPAMVNYYFGSKSRLVDAFVEERLLPAILEQQSEALSQLDGDAGQLIGGFVRGMHRIIEKHPWLPSLWVREVLTEGGQLRQVFTDRIAPALPQPLARRFAAAQARGELNPDLDPRLLFVSLIGLTMLPFAAAPIWRRVFDADQIGSEQLLEHTLALLNQGILP